MKKVKWGILGCANIARKAVIPGIKTAANSKLEAVASRSGQKAEDFAAEFEAEKHYDSYQKLLADPLIDAVYIPLPNSLHLEWTLKAAAAGKHILCEKPLAGKNEKEAEQMLAAAKENGVKLMEAFMYRFQPFVIELKKDIEEGIIGQLKEIQANFAFDISDRKNEIRLNPDLEGGALNDIGCYTVNISRYLMGEMPTKVVNFFEKKTAAGVDLSGSGTLFFEGGRFASLYYSLNSYPEKDLVLIGSKGVIKIPDFFAWKDENYYLLKKEGQEEKVKLNTASQYKLEVEAFARAIIKEQEVPLKVETETYNNLKLMAALRESAKLEKVIKI